MFVRTLLHAQCSMFREVSVDPFPTDPFHLKHSNILEWKVSCGKDVHHQNDQLIQEASCHSVSISMHLHSLKLVKCMHPPTAPTVAGPQFAVPRVKTPKSFDCPLTLRRFETFETFEPQPPLPGIPSSRMLEWFIVI